MPGLHNIVFYHLLQFFSPLDVLFYYRSRTLLFLILSLHLNTAHGFSAFPLFYPVFSKKSMVCSSFFPADSLFTHCIYHFFNICSATFNCIIFCMMVLQNRYLFCNKSLKLSMVLPSFNFITSYFILLLFCIHFLSLSLSFSTTKK